ncbi:uncharacterized protein [Notothenia coriiceps]|uniref:Uncharacterized protein n=1 Tax=Notothenia coriiceps TaxID=8208 RepID=A0A6I9NJA1_9TELE|nr:PREDICTED: uncharacterized protein LOC104952566 [Notothenia coriiceps]
MQLGQATKHQDKLPTTTLLCTTTATFQSQALPAFMPSQNQERSILTQSLPPTVTSARLLGAVPKPTALLARSTVMSLPIVQGMQAAGHVGQQLLTTTGYQPSHQLPATQQSVAQHPVVMPQQSSYVPHNWSVAPSPYTQSDVPQQTAYQSLPVLPAQYAYQQPQYPPQHQAIRSYQQRKLFLWWRRRRPTQNPEGEAACPRRTPKKKEGRKEGFFSLKKVLQLQAEF